MCTRRSSEAAPPVAQSSPVQPSPVQSTHHTRHLTYEAGITASDLGFSLAPASPLCTCTFWPQHPQRIYIPSKESVSGALASNFKHDPPERAYRTVFRPPPRPATHPRSQPLTTPTPTRAPTHTHTHTHRQPPNRLRSIAPRPQLLAPAQSPKSSQKTFISHLVHLQFLLQLMTSHQEKERRRKEENIARNFSGAL